MLTSTPVLVFLRIFAIPLVLIAAYFFAFGKAGGHQAYVNTALEPHLASLMQQLDGFGSSARAYVAPIANAKFTSSRTLSGGDFIRP